MKQVEVHALIARARDLIARTAPSPTSAKLETRLETLSVFAEPAERLRVNVATRPRHRHEAWRASIPGELSRRIETSPTLLEQGASHEPIVHAWILFLNAEQLGAIAEKEFYEDVRMEQSSRPTIALIIDRLDHMRAEERAAIEGYAREIFSGINQCVITDPSQTIVLQRWLDELTGDLEAIHNDAREHAASRLLVPVRNLRAELIAVRDELPQPTLTDDDVEKVRRHIVGIRSSLTRWEASLFMTVRNAARAFMKDAYGKYETNDELAKAARLWLERHLVDTISSEIRLLISGLDLVDGSKVTPHVATWLRSDSDVDTCSMDIVTPTEDGGARPELALISGMSIIGAGLAYLIPIPLPRALRTMIGAVIGPVITTTRHWMYADVASPETRAAIDAQLDAYIETSVGVAINALVDAFDTNSSKFVKDMEAQLRTQTEQRDAIEAATQNVRHASALLLELELLQERIDAKAKKGEEE